jgi:hypothetical protein
MKMPPSFGGQLVQFRRCRRALADSKVRSTSFASSIAPTEAFRKWQMIALSLPHGAPLTAIRWLD